MLPTVFIATGFGCGIGFNINKFTERSFKQNRI